MRRLLFGFCLLALWGCAEQLPDRIYPVFFTPFSTQLDPPALAIVANAAATSKRFPKATVHVTGYADPTPGNVDVDQLSRARADAVMAQLVQDGVPSAMIVSTGGGTPPASQPGVQERRAEIDLDLP